jgi:hypothetical protein
MTLQLTDDYKVRNDILGQLQRHANTWFELALSRAPIELQSTLQVRVIIAICIPSYPIFFSVQKYLAAAQPVACAGNAELGASIAEKFAKAFGPVHRQLCKWSCTSRVDRFSDHFISQLLCVTCQIGSLIVPAFLPVNLRANATLQGRLLVYGSRLVQVSRST